MEELNEIKAVIGKILSRFGQEIEKIILFGSRAAGTQTKYSDYDLLVVIKATIPIEKKIEISAQIRSELAKEKIDADIIIKSGEETETYKEYIGTIVREALKEGVVI